MTDEYPDFGIEEWEDDPNRIRLFNPHTGYRGQWFSRLRHTDDFGILNVPQERIDEVFPIIIPAFLRTDIDPLEQLAQDEASERWLRHITRSAK